MIFCSNASKLVQLFETVLSPPQAVVARGYGLISEAKNRNFMGPGHQGLRTPPTLATVYSELRLTTVESSKQVDTIHVYDVCDGSHLLCQIMFVSFFWTYMPS